MLLDQFSSRNIMYLWSFMTHLFYFRLLTSFLASFMGKFNLLMLCGEIESNPGPCSNSGQSFSICDWNLNIIAAHNFSDIFLLKTDNAIHDCNGTRTHNHLIRKRTLNHLAKLAK